MQIETIIAESSLILAECAISERIRRDKSVELHPTLFLTPLIYDAHGRMKMTEIYKQYRQIALAAAVPIILCAPTWRLDRMRLAEAGFNKSLIQDAVAFMFALQKRHQHSSSAIILGSLIAPKNDCYSPAEALSAEDAEAFHSWQIELLAESEVECIIAQTIPAVSEALGIANAISAKNAPYIISFVINQNGEVLDGTPLPQAMATIDENVATPPLGYMVNCVYPTFIGADLHPYGSFDRLIGIQANSSSLDHSQLDGSAILHQDDLTHWGDSMLLLNSEYGVKILGGCCGTDDTYLRYIIENFDDDHGTGKE